MQSKAPVAFRLFPSFADVVFMAPLAFLAARTDGVKTLLGDGDTGWHLRTGEWILANHRVPYQDLFSFTKPSQPWFAWEWLWDVLFAGLYRFGGMAAVILASMLVISTAFLLVYDLAKKKSGNAVISIVITLLAVISSSYHWLARPHLVTLLMAAIFLRWLEQGSRRAIIFGLPALMVLWTNLHGGFIAGLILIGTYAIGEFARSYFLDDEEARNSSRKRGLLFLQSLALCGAATFVNPYFYQLHYHIWSYFTDGYQMKNIGEFQSINFHHALSRMFEAFLILALAAAFWSLLRKQFTHFLLLMSWMHFALVSGRNIAIFAVVAAPLIAAAVQHWLVRMEAPLDGWRLPAFARRMAEACKGITAVESIPRWHVASVGFIGLFAAMLFAPVPAPRFVAEYDSHAYPEGALRSLKDADLKERIFSTDIWGGYLIYRLYPQVKVFLDGRSDFYGPEFEERYNDVVSAKPCWNESLHRFGVRTVLLPPEAQLTSAMKESHNWRCTYDDGTALVFRSVDQVRTDSEKVSAAQPAAGSTATWLSQAAVKKREM